METTTRRSTAILVALSAAPTTAREGSFDSRPSTAAIRSLTLQHQASLLTRTGLHYDNHARSRAVRRLDTESDPTHARSTAPVVGRGAARKTLWRADLEQGSLSDGVSQVHGGASNKGKTADTRLRSNCYPLRILPVKA